MNCMEIVRKYLEDNGYDGLYHECDCACDMKDLFACGEDISECKPGYKKEREPGGEYDYYICGEKGTGQ